MSKKSMKSAVAATSASRRKAEIEMVNAIGNQVNQMVSTICSAAVESRRIDFEGLESKDRADVLKSEGTTLVALSKSADETIVALWEASAPMVAQVLSAMAASRGVEANARLIEAQADMVRAETEAKQAEVEDRLAEIREQELEVKIKNAETEALKAEAAYTNGVA